MKITRIDKMIDDQLGAIRIIVQGNIHAGVCYTKWQFLNKNLTSCKFLLIIEIWRI